jgi:hypothetical protein
MESHSPLLSARLQKLREEGWRFEWDVRTGFIGAVHPHGGKQTVAEIHGGSLLDKDMLGLGITKALNRQVG